MMAFILRCASFRKVNFAFVFSVMETVDKLSYERESIFDVFKEATASSIFVTVFSTSEEKHQDIWLPP
jgi:hypothetical protein